MVKQDDLQQKTPEELAEIILSLQGSLNKKDTVITQQHNTIQQLYEQLRLNRYKRFGAKSEKDIDGEHQHSLFDEAKPPENKSEIEDADETLTIPEHQRKKKKGRKGLPKNLPREQKIYDIADKDKVCACGCELTHFANEVTEQLEIIPAKIYIIEHICKKYACKSCESTIKQAKKPKQPIAKSIAGPGLLAHTLVAKFEDHLPLYRQEHILQRIGVDIPRATLSNWVIKCAELLSPLTKLLLDYIYNYDVGYADETTVQVLNEPGRSAQSKSYMWVFGGGPPDKFSLVYHYAPSRGHAVALEVLDSFTGYLHCDGYQGYDLLAKKTDIKQVGCWYHLRRKFKDAQKVSPKDGLAKHAIQVIKKLSLIEKQAGLDKLSPEQRYEVRQRKALPIINAFKQWIIENKDKAPSKSLLGEAFTYAKNQWPKLLVYLEDGRLEFSNNRTERAIKPFALGRKNWLFANSVSGANAAATIYTLIQTCKHHKVQPYYYLRYILSKLPTCTTIDELDNLLPFNIDKELLK